MAEPSPAQAAASAQALGEPGAAIHAPAITLSVLCLIHCLALPVLAVSLPVLTGLAEMHWLHKGFALLAFPISGLAIWQCLRSGRSHRLFIGLALLGLALLGIGSFSHEISHDLEPYETLLVSIGGITLASAHLTHWIGHRRNADCCQG